MTNLAQLEDFQQEKEITKLRKDAYYEQDLHLSMALKLLENEISVEQGGYPVDREHAITLYVKAALESIRKIDELS